ncbi:MAG: peptide-methionine (S)-S-oxide reductase MsrA [Vicinamibacterales bacterium]
MTRADGVRLPAPVVDTALAQPGAPIRKAVVAGGCFWGIQLVYQHVRGVTTAVSGYAGGSAETANYEAVGTDTTGHAEAVEISYDPTRVTYGQLLHVLFSVGHDPTTLNRQGPDNGSQYRSVIFFTDAEQEKIARAYIAQLDQAGTFKHPIVTQVVKLPAFYRAEDYHQDYATLHPRDPYIAINDLPKLTNFRTLFSTLYVGK